MSGDPIRRLIPVMGYRVERCLPRDRKAVVALFKNLFESGEVGEDPLKHNPIAQRHLALSALWHDTDPSADALQRMVDTALLTTAVSAGVRAHPARLAAGAGPHVARSPGLERSAPDAARGAGSDDAAGTARASLRTHFTGKAQTFAIVTGAGHVTINENPCVRSIYVAVPSRARGGSRYLVPVGPQGARAGAATRPRPGGSSGPTTSGATGPGGSGSTADLHRDCWQSC